MAEEKKEFIFDEKSILKQLFADLEQSQMQKKYSNIQTGKWVQENIYQSARERQRQKKQSQEDNLKTEVARSSKDTFGCYSTLSGEGS